jgi:endonuclease YncB( thermonuclease family)
MKNGSDINRLQLRRGHATVYVYDHHPFRRVRDYRGAQAAAKRHDLGLWKACR